MSCWRSAKSATTTEIAKIGNQTAGDRRRCRVAALTRLGAAVARSVGGRRTFERSCISFPAGQAVRAQAAASGAGSSGACNDCPLGAARAALTSADTGSGSRRISVSAVRDPNFGSVCRRRNLRPDARKPGTAAAVRTAIRALPAADRVGPSPGAILGTPVTRVPPRRSTAAAGADAAQTRRRPRAPQVAALPLVATGAPRNSQCEPGSHQQGERQSAPLGGRTSGGPARPGESCAPGLDRATR